MCRGSRSLNSRVAIFGRPPGCVVALLSASLLCATPATSQIVTGRVVDASDEPVGGVAIVLLDTLAAEGREVVSNASGVFFLAARAPGTYRLRASHGEATVETRLIEIGEGEAVEVELKVDAAQEAEPLEIVRRRRETRREKDVREFYERVEVYGERAVGSTQIYSRASLEQYDALSLAEFFTLYSRWTPYGSGCSPKAFVDGQPRALRNVNFLRISTFEGIELYSGSGPTRSRFWDPDGCGVVLVWTNMARESGGGLGIVEVLAITGAAALLGLFFIF